MTESNGLGSKGLIIAVTMLIIVGSVTAFVVTQAWNTMNPNPYETDRIYSFEGEMDGKACTGSGIMKFKNESGVWHLYSLDYTLETTTAKQIYHLGVLFNEKDTPDPSLYEYLGERTVDDVGLSLWKAVDSGIEYVMYVGDKCSIVQLDIVSEDLNIIGHRTS